MMKRKVCNICVCVFKYTNVVQMSLTHILRNKTYTRVPLTSNGLWTQKANVLKCLVVVPKTTLIAIEIKLVKTLLCKMMLCLFIFYGSYGMPLFGYFCSKNNASDFFPSNFGITEYFGGLIQHSQ